MAEIANKLEENVEGRYYVDDQCIACGACATEAPECFELDSEETHYVVKKQPETEEEKEACDNAIKACPVDAIGDDGEEE